MPSRALSVSSTSSRASFKSSTSSSAASSASSAPSSTSTPSATYASVLKSTPGSPAKSRVPSISSILKSSSTESYFSPKSYLTIRDLYMRYAPLNTLTKSRSTTLFSKKSRKPRVLPLMTLEDLFNKFAPKLRATPLNPPSVAKHAAFSTQQTSQKPSRRRKRKSPSISPQKSTDKSSAQKPSSTSEGSSESSSPATPIQPSITAGEAKPALLASPQYLPAQKKEAGPSVAAIASSSGGEAVTAITSSSGGEGDTAIASDSGGEVVTAIASNTVEDVAAVESDYSDSEDSDSESEDITEYVDLESSWIVVHSSHHICNSTMKDRFIKEYEKDNVEYGTLQVNIKVPGVGDGVYDDCITLANVKYVPHHSLNIVAKRKLEEKGAIVDYESQLIRKNGQPIMILTKINGFLVLEDNTKNTT